MTGPASSDDKSPPAGAIRQSGPGIPAAHADAVRAFEEGDMAQALSLLDRACIQVPDYYPSLVLRGRIFLLVGDGAKAEQDFSRCLTLMPESLTARLGLGLAQFQTGARESALHNFRDLVGRHCDAWQGYGSIADICADESERLAALEAMRDCLVRLVETAGRMDLLAACADAHINMRAPEDAARLLDRFVGLLPDKARQHDLRARAAYFSGDFTRALHHKIQSFLETGPEHVAGARALNGLDPAKTMDAIAGLCARLGEAGLILVPLSGTLLGLVRSGAVLPQDRDVDIGYIRPSNVRADPVDLIRAAPDLLLNRHARRGDRYLPVMCGQTSVDLFRLDRTDGYFVFSLSDRPGDVQWRVPVFDPGEPGASGLRLPAPGEARACLRALYGPGWQVPDPCFASAVSSPALWQVSPHVRAYYAVHRARTALIQSVPDRARGLLAQSPLPIPTGAARLQEFLTRPSGA